MILTQYIEGTASGYTQDTQGRESQDTLFTEWAEGDQCSYNIKKNVWGTHYLCGHNSVRNEPFATILVSFDRQEAGLQ